MDNTSLEYYANWFACELLMPKDPMGKAYDKNIRKITALSDLFCVPIQSVKLRAKQLGYFIKYSS